jgi:hypothetical protein
MKKKLSRHVAVHHKSVAKKVTKTVKAVKSSKPSNLQEYLLAIKGWMFVVAFALMLGIGAVVGTYFNQLLNASVPTVAGAQIEVGR